MFSGLVESQFERPNFGAAIIFFALPFILQLFFSFMFVGQPDLGSFLIHVLAPAAISWFVCAAILYILLIGFKGRAASGKFGSVLASLSVFNLVCFIALLLMSAVFFAGVPELFQKGGLTSIEMFNATYAISSNPQPNHWAVLGIGLLIGIGAAVSYLYIAAKIARLTKETGAFSDSVLAVIFAFISATTFFIISGFFQGI